MKKPKIIIGLVTAALLIGFLLVKVESPRCESPPLSLNNAQSQAARNDAKSEKFYDPDVQDEKSDRFKIMEWVIRQNLMKQYEKLVANEDLLDNLD